MTRSAQTTEAGRPDRGAAARDVILAAAAAAVLLAGVAAIAYAIWRGGRPQPSTFTYDLTELRRTDPALLVAQESSPAFPTGFRESRCITVSPAGEIWVTGDGAARRFEASGRRLGEIAVGAPASAIAVDANGMVFLAAGREVLAFDPAGQPKARWSVEAKEPILTSLAVTDQDVFIADAGSRMVWRYDRAGRLRNAIGRRDESRNVPGFSIPSPYFDLAMGPDGLLRVVNPGRHRIEAYTPAGDFELAWGRPSGGVAGFCGCCNPSNFALLAGRDGFGQFDGFITAEKGLTRVKLYDAEGSFVGIVAGPESFQRHDELLTLRPTDQPFHALDLAAAPDGGIYVLDPMTNEVRTFRRTKPAASAPSAEGKP